MNITLEDVLKRIAVADDCEISEIMEAIWQRFHTAFPDWDVFYLSCPKNDPLQRQQTLEALTEYLNA